MFEHFTQLWLKLLTLILILFAALSVNLIFLASATQRPHFSQSNLQLQPQQRLRSMTTHSSAQKTSTIHKARMAWLQGKADVFAQLFSPTGEFIVPGQQWVGVEAIRNAATSYFKQYTVASIEIQRILVAGDRVMVEWNWLDVERFTDQRTWAEDVIVIDFNGDRIQRWREYIDTQTSKALDETNNISIGGE
ncbi:MAG: nuclear transport factor 2 family protein [Cyanobacteria bacterium P01_D01_bin.123]